MATNRPYRGKNRTRWNKNPKKKRRPDFIYNGDLCFFKKPAHAFPCDENWSYNPNIQRVIWPGEHLRYVKRLRKNRSGWMHCIESYGMFYVYEGSIKDFTKDHVPYKEGWDGK